MSPCLAIDLPISKEFHHGRDPTGSWRRQEAPFYNIVVADSRERRDGRFIERVGFYNPVAAGAEQPLRVSLDRVTHWTGVGAQMSPTVARLVDQAKKAA